MSESLKNSEALLRETCIIVNDAMNDLIVRGDKLAEVEKKSELIAETSWYWESETRWRKSGFIYKMIWKGIYHTINFLGYYVPSLFCACCVTRNHLYQMQNRLPRDKLLSIWWYPGCDRSVV